ncbi:MAG: phosphate transport system substrate-binding protein [Thermoanaerobaculia bacterium]|jgi:phosphate transport system substrate-binding protein|nr:phosphate transport system substrate-binding protein [Thermoanaerobaculia bacterium]
MPAMNKAFTRSLFVYLALFAFAACAPQENSNQAAATGPIAINGAGATFPYPIYSKWFDEYQKSHPDVRINYQSIGSGGGIKQLTAQTVFFGASDGPMTDAQLKAAPGPVLHFPTVLGGVVPVYNVPGITQPLRFSGTVLASIYLGKITKWNDAAIAQLNPGVTLPATDIAVVHRSDGSGTTYIFCDYLSKVSPEFKQQVGVATSVSWPAGVGAKGNEGISGLVQQTPGAIGYVELIFALQNKIAFGAVQNKSGQFVTASLESVTAAAAGVSMPDDFRVSITNPDAANAYPVASFTWMLLYQHPTDKVRGKTMVDFLKWALADGQKLAPSLGYAPLPAPVVEKELQALATVQ